MPGFGSHLWLFTFVHASLKKAPAATVATKHHLSFPAYRSPRASPPQGTACPVTRVQLQPQQGQTSSRLLLTHLRGAFKLCQAVLGSARNVENAERNSRGSRCRQAAGAASAGMLPVSLGIQHNSPGSAGACPQAVKWDRKLWSIFVWHRHCPVLDLCHDGSRMDTSSTRLAETYLRTHGAFATRILLLRPKYLFPYLC